MEIKIKVGYEDSKEVRCFVTTPKYNILTDYT